MERHEKPRYNLIIQPLIYHHKQNALILIEMSPLFYEGSNKGIKYARYDFCGLIRTKMLPIIYQSTVVNILNKLQYKMLFIKTRINKR